MIIDFQAAIPTLFALAVYEDLAALAPAKNALGSHSQARLRRAATVQASPFLTSQTSWAVNGYVLLLVVKQSGLGLVLVLVLALALALAREPWRG